MLPKNPLTQLFISRASGTVRRLEKEIWTRSADLEVYASAPQQEQVGLEVGKDLSRSKVEAHTSWGRLFDQRWCKVEFPRATDGEDWMFWEDQGEATLYIDDVPYFGFNIAHRRCKLPAGVTEAWVQSSCIQSCIWLQEETQMKAGSLFEGAYLARRDDLAWEAYQDFKCLFDLALDQRSRENPALAKSVRCAGEQPLVDRYSPAFRLMLRVMDDASDALDTGGLQAFRDVLKNGYTQLREEKSFSKCILSGHAHVDLVWIWPERMGELKAVNVFATANHLINAYPEFKFAYSQPASYQAVARREPELYAAVEERIQEGTWQATGAMQVESDTLIACGEALARSFTVGQDGFSEINGEPSSLTWLPDVFGYSACLPQIMAQTGVKYFFTTKMTWNAVNRFPYSSFTWEGHDGSSVLAHVTQDAGYVSHMEVDRVKAPMLANQQADLHREFLLPVGYGDGGGGVTDDMLERARRLSAMPGMPELEWGHPEAFFERLESIQSDLPTHQGECYLEYHRGTYTTHCKLKSVFRKLERALQVAEAASVLSGKRWDMDAAWKKLIFAQFHDYIPGSSVWDVYIEDLPNMDHVAEAQFAQAAEALTGNGDPCLLNPHALPVKRWITTEAGKQEWVHLAPLSGTRLSDAIQTPPNGLQIEGNTVSNGLSSFTLNSMGWIQELSFGETPVPVQSPLGQLVLYPDRPGFYDAWDIDRAALSLGTLCDSEADIESFQNEHSAGFKISRKIGEKSSACICFCLQAGKPEIYTTIELDWNEPEHLLKLHFPTDYSAPHVRCGIPFGSILRPTQAGNPKAEAMWEMPFSRYLSVFDEGELNGLSLITEDKYGASVQNGNVGISLVRSPRVTGFETLMHRAWPAHLSQYGENSRYSDLGNHTIQLALSPYSINAPREQQPAALADTLFTEPVEYLGNPYAPLISELKGGESLVPCWAKPSDDGSWILRFSEVSGQRGAVEIQTADGSKLSETQLDEAKSVDLGDNGKLSFKPYQLKSVRFAR
ncbi:MAG: alpha-mannosidase [Opitutales bacterium]